MKLLVFILSLSFVSCYSDPNLKSKIRDYQILKEDYIASNFSDYQHIRSKVTTELTGFVADSISHYSSLLLYPSWQVDSLLIFNSDSTRFYTRLYNNSERVKNRTSDYFYDFGGAKIDGRWYFFMMGTFTVVPRDHYHHDPYEPLTFEELSYIAWRRSIPGLIYRDDQGKVVGNSKAIDRMFLSPDKYHCPDPDRVRQCNDSITLAQHKIWTKGKKSKAEIQRIEAKIEATTRPPAPPPRKWYQQPKLFDSKAWRDRRSF